MVTLSTHCELIVCHSLGSTAMATPSTVLDVPPYNSFSLNCSVSVNPSTPPIFTITYQWTGNHVTQSDTAIISVSTTTAGSSSYQCSATVNVPMLNPVVTNDTTTVTVRGRKQMVHTVCHTPFWRAIILHAHVTYAESEGVCANLSY